jgi:hypothetical protein
MSTEHANGKRPKPPIAENGDNRCVYVTFCMPIDDPGAKPVITGPFLTVAFEAKFQRIVAAHPYVPWTVIVLADWTDKGWKLSQRYPVDPGRVFHGWIITDGMPQLEGRAPRPWWEWCAPEDQPY